MVKLHHIPLTLMWVPEEQVLIHIHDRVTSCVCIYTDQI